jgi:3-oxoacyl-[acyl-carrier-protein] synthase-3
MAVTPALIGTGFAVPAQVRLNTDPILAKLYKEDPKLFTGYKERRVLGPGETLTSLMVEAASNALAAARLAPADVDLLLGYGSVAQYITPNNLAQVHLELGLRRDIQVLPLADDFTNFNSAFVLADALIRAGTVRNALIVVGDNWTQYVSYDTQQAISAGDAAGAAVVAPATDGAQWTLADQVYLTESDDYGDMYMASDGPGSNPYFHITDEGLKDFVTFGMHQAPALFDTLIARHGITAATMICHQASQTLLDAWQRPQLTILTTMAEYGNIVLAAVPVTLAALGDKITTDQLILFCLGAQLQASALLLVRNSGG